MAAGLHYRLDWNVLDSYFQMQEVVATPGNVEANNIRLYATDNGSGISTLCIKNDNQAVICWPTVAGTLVTGAGVATRVAFWDGVSNLSSDADLTFATDTLSATKLASSFLTATQLVYAGAAGLLTSISELTFVPTAANSSIITLGDDSHTAVLNVPAGFTINLDSNNNDTGALLAIQVNTALRLTGGTRLFTINESGALALGNGVDFGVSGQALITQGNAASPTWVTLVTDHGALTGLLDDDHTQYRLESENHTHQSSGAQAGTLDHGLALTGLTDDDHTQYVLRSILTTRGDLFTRDASVIIRLAVGASAGMFLRSDATDPGWSTLILPNAITANNIVYGSATNTYGQSTNLTFDGTDFLLGSGIRARMVGQNRFRHLNSMARVQKTANQTAIAVTTWTTMTFDSEPLDTDGLHDNATNNSRLTFPLAGKWLVVSHIYTDVAGITTPTKLATRILISGGTTTIYGYMDIMLTGGPTDPGLSSSGIVDVAANQYVEMQAIVLGAAGTWVAQFVGGLTSFEAFYIGE